MDQEIEETKVYNWQINERIDKLVKKLRVNKLCIEEKEVLYNLLNKVLLNETTKENKNKLLDVIEEVNCYKDLEIDEYINSTITHIISTEIREKYMILKDKISSSNHTIISKVLKDGLLEEDNLTDIFLPAFGTESPVKVNLYVLVSSIVFFTVFGEPTAVKEPPLTWL